MIKERDFELFQTLFDRHGLDAYATMLKIMSEFIATDISEMETDADDAESYQDQLECQDNAGLLKNVKKAIDKALLIAEGNL